jgi:hypothetical protein
MSVCHCFGKPRRSRTFLFMPLPIIMWPGFRSGKGLLAPLAGLFAERPRPIDVVGRIRLVTI